MKVGNEFIIIIICNKLTQFLYKNHTCDLQLKMKSFKPFQHHMKIYELLMTPKIKRNEKVLHVMIL